MRLKAFNKDKSLKKLKYKRNKDKYIMFGTLSFSFIVFIAGIIFFAYARYESEKEFTLINATVGDFKSGDYTIAAYVDGAKSRSIPAKDSGYYLQKVECESGTGTWDSNTWALTVEGATTQTKCYVYFTTLIAEADTTGQYATLSKYYPIGSIYQTTTNDNPATLFGGTWTKIEGKFLLSSSSNYTLGSTGGSADAVLVSHSHTKGTMNITGTLTVPPWTTGANPFGGTGAFQTVTRLTGGYSSVAYGADKNPFSFAFNAANSWTGSTSVEGESGTGKNMPPYEVVNVWKRTA